MIVTAIPVIVYLKWEYDDNGLPGAVVSVMIVFGVMELAKKDDQAGQVNLKILYGNTAARPEWL